MDHAARGFLCALALLVGALAAVPASPARAGTREVDALAAARLRLDFGAPTAALGPLAGLGDVNGDGRADVAVAAPTSTPDPTRRLAGRVFVVFGSTAMGTVALADSGFQVLGAARSRAGTSVEAAGDVNGDGRADLLLTAPIRGTIGDRPPGSAYVVFGKADGATVDLARLSSSQGFEIVGIRGGTDTIAGVGDIDRDGYADILISRDFRKRRSDYRGGAAVVYGGRRSARVDLQRLGSRGFHIAYAISPRSSFRESPGVAGAGDVNDDGRADLLLRFDRVLAAGRDFPAPGVFVVFGRRYRATLDLGRLGSQGFRITGGLNLVGASGVGDLNRDGRDDLAIIRLQGSRPDVALVFGSGSGRAVDLTRLGRRGFRIVNPPGYLDAVVGLGDVGGDGAPDLGLSAPPRESGTPSAYVVYGRRATSTLRLDDLGAAGVRYTGVSPFGRGSSIAPAGDFNGDRRRDILLRAPGQGLIVTPRP